MATVNPQNGPVKLKQGGDTNFKIMINPGVEGQDVSNTIGFSGVLNSEDWAELGMSPSNYWRAHGYAKSFGGAGDIKNVGWWQEASESQWTAHEQQVRGAGEKTIHGWEPGDQEKGDYLVERKMYPRIILKEKYIRALNSAIQWGFSDEREAWKRTIESCNSIFPIKEREKRIALILQEKKNCFRGADMKVRAWIDMLFGSDSLESNLIKSMKMTYTIEDKGIDGGAERKNKTCTISSSEPKANYFGLKNKPKELWVEMLNANKGVFSKGASPVRSLTHSVAYENNPFKPEQLFIAHGDGWGKL